MQGPLRLVVFQGTAYCNLNCRYCYLTEESRQTRALMPIEVVEQTTRRIVDEGLAGPLVDFVWHAGEPLVAGIKYYEECFTAIQRAAKSQLNYRLVFQTNGTLIDHRWCELFKKHNVMVGVSVDGPAFLHDKNRLTWTQKPTHARVMKGLELLKDHAISFQIIAVLTPVSLEYPDAIFQFMMESGCTRFGFNVEEEEGRHRSDIKREGASLDIRFKGFMNRIYDLAFSVGRPEMCREFRNVMQSIPRLTQHRHPQLTMQTKPFGTLVVNTNGDFSTFSPELLTLKSSEYPDFIFGNIYSSSFSDALQTEKLQKIATEIKAGVVSCSQTCAYFNACYGVAPSNKLMENGSFNSTETAFCRFSRQAIVDVILDNLHGRVNMLLEDGL